MWCRVRVRWLAVSKQLLIYETTQSSPFHLSIDIGENLQQHSLISVHQIEGKWEVHSFPPIYSNKGHVSLCLGGLEKALKLAFL